MNCQLCQKELEAYLGDRLSPDTRTQVDEHLQTCKECAESFRILSIAEKVFENEKKLLSDPFLSDRIMASIEKIDAPVYSISPFRKIIRPAFIAASMAAAIFLGVMIGRIYQPVVADKSVPVELALIDDASIESVDILSYE
jgi:anti-sigma factor RsiW